MLKHEKQISAGLIIALTILLLCLLGLFGIIVWNIVIRINNGWSNNDTVQTIFFALVAITGCETIRSLQDYLVSKNSKILFLRNDIYRLFIDIERNGCIEKFEDRFVNEENKRRIERINKIVQKKDKTANVTINNLNDYFDAEHKFYKRNANLFQFARLTKLYVKIIEHKSRYFETLYASIHSGEYIQKKQFPIFEFILPLLIGVIGIFVTIYEASSVSGPIDEPLIEYLKLFGLMVLFALIFSFLTLRSRTEDEIDSKKKLLKELKEIND